MIQKRRRPGVTAAPTTAALATGAGPGPTAAPTTATQMLVELVKDLAERGVTLVFARLKVSVAAYLDRAGVDVAGEPSRVYLEVDDAVAAFRSVSDTAAGRPSSAMRRWRRTGPTQEHRQRGTRRRLAPPGSRDRHP